MASTGSILKWGGLAFLGYKLISYVGGKITTAQALTASVKNVQLGKVNFPTLQLTMQVQINNPTSNDATATSIVGNLQNVNGQQLGIFNVALNAQQQIIVPANSNALVNVNIELNVLNTAISILNTGFKAIINATVVVDGISLPLTSNVEISASGVTMSGYKK